MRTSNVLFVLYLGCVWSARDPCTFVGFRFAKTISHCLEGMCTGFELIQGVFVPESFTPSDSRLGRSNVSCDQAQVSMNRIFAPTTERAIPDEEIPWSVAAGLPADLKTALFLISTEIVPAMNRMYLSRQTATDALLGHMATIETIFAKYFQDTSRWTLVEPLIETTLEFNELLQKLNLMAEWSRFVPYSIDIFSGLTAPFIHFGFDLVALVGQSDNDQDQSELDALSIAASCNPVTYRAAYPQELKLNCRATFVNDAQASLDIARDMVKLSQDPHDEVAVVSLSRLVSYLPFHPPPSESAVMRMLRHQLQRDICPQLSKIFDGSSFWSENVKVAVSLIHHCSRRSIGYQQGIEASLSLPSVSPRPDLLTRPCPLSLSEALVNENFTWIEGFADEALESISGIVTDMTTRFITVNEPFIKRGDVSTFKPRKMFASSKQFEVVNRGLGRILGLCVRYTLPCGTRMGIPHGLLNAIVTNEGFASILMEIQVPQTRFRSFRDIGDFIRENVQEPAFYISLGIRDVIGPAGIYAIDSSAQFG